MRGEAAIVFALSASFVCGTTPYAPWAHEHWVWLSADRSTQPAVEEFAQSFRDHKIPVGAIDIDSTWSKGINDFVPDTSKFPDLGALVAGQHSNGTMVILWATSMVDTDSSNYQEMSSNGYNIRNALNETSTLHWWHGDGLLLDYTYDKAVDWWQDALDNVLKLGIDGWKVDGTDPFIIEYLDPQGHAGPVSYREYATDYYSHFFAYTRQQNGPHCLIMSRPVDSYNVIGAEIQVYLDFSPRDVMFSGWVGDQDPTFEGMQDALRNLLHSGWNNYTGFGSDIGGYRSGHGAQGRTAELFLRWAQMGAFLPLMENGGDKEHRPWAFDAPGSTVIVDAYRALVAAHMELQPYLLSHGARAYETNSSLVLPFEPRPQDEQELIQYNNFSSYDYSLGPSIFVHPVSEANVTRATVHLPATPTGKGWFDWFDRNRTYPSNATVQVEAPLTVIPVFGRQGDIVPLHVSTRYTGRGGPSPAKGALTLAVNSPHGWDADLDVLSREQAPEKVSVDLREHMGPDAAAWYSAGPAKDGRPGLGLQFEVGPVGRDVRLLLDGMAARADRVSVSVTSGACGSGGVAVRAEARGSIARGPSPAYGEWVASPEAGHDLAAPLPLSRFTQYDAPGASAPGGEPLPAAYKVVERLPVPPSTEAPWWAHDAPSGEGRGVPVASRIEVWAGAGDEGLCVEVGA